MNNLENTEEKDIESKLNESIISKKEELKRLEEDIEKKRAAFDCFIDNEKQKLENARNVLSEKLIIEELNFKTKLEEEKLKKLAETKEKFLEEYKKEYNKLNIKFNELTKKDLELIERNQILDLKEEALNKEKEIFESNKDAMLNKFKEELEQERLISKNQQEEKNLKNKEKANQEIEDMYRDKELEYSTKRDELKKKKK